VRDALLMTIVVALCLVSLVRARIGLLGYTWYALMRPDALAWSGANPYSFSIAVATILGSVPSLPARLPVLFHNPLTLLLLLLHIPFVLSAIFALDPQLAYPNLFQHLRGFVMALLIPLLLADRKGAKWVTLVMGVSVGLIGAKFGMWGLWHGGARFARGYYGMMLDNNALGLAVAMGLPLLWFGMRLVEQLWAKVTLFSLFFLSLAGAVMTYSRTTALALAAAFLLIAYRSKHKLVILVAIALLATPLLLLLGSSYLERLATISNPTEESSAYSRLIMWKAGWRLFLEHPVLGVGFGRDNQQAVIRRFLPPEAESIHEVLVMHSTWMQLLVDSGIFAFLLYTALMAITIWNLGKAYRRTRKTDPELAAIAAGLHASIVAFAVGATFLSRVEFDLYYMLVATAAALYEIRRESDKASAPAALSGDQPESGLPTSLSAPAGFPLIRIRHPGGDAR